MRAILSVFLLSMLLASAGHTAETVPPAAKRFANPETQESPDFQRHVIPLLGRLGCNGRACHGSFQGRGGLRLSLFGYDFDADFRGLTRDTGDHGETRINRKRPLDSLLLRKPTLEIDHEGGRRFDKGDWRHNLLQRWVAEGAKQGAKKNLRRLQVEPAAIVLAEAGQSQPIRILAHWDDGSVEDVTCLSRVKTGDEVIAAVDASGRVLARGRGDTHLIAMYDQGVVSIPIVIPVSELADTGYPDIDAPTKVDALVIAKLRRLGVLPSEICGDAEFLRRVSIDLTGTLPTPQEVEAFLADDRVDKRDRKIEQLLHSPAYAAWWANRICDFTGNNPFRQSEGRLGQTMAVQWYTWVYRRLAMNTPYDEIAAGIVLATSRDPSQSYRDFADEMSSYLREGGEFEFAKRATMPHYWSRRNVQKPEEKSLAIAHSFLGIQLQCAQCHKHPHDRWTQEDFRQLARFFSPLEFGVSTENKGEFEQLAKAAGQSVQGRNLGMVTQEAAAKAEQGQTVAWRELFVNYAQAPQGRLQLLGNTVSVAEGEDPRVQLMDWMRSPDNPYFARSFVNRVWANYFHRGIIEPVDDLNAANPPSNPELLDYLADGFFRAGFDLKWLHREIVRSDTYQRSWRPNATNRDDRRNFSRAIPRRLAAEVLYDALKQATADDAELLRVREELDRRAIGHLATRMAGTYAQRVFGQPERLINCDCERSNTPTLLQSIFMQNDPLVQIRLEESGWLAGISSDSSKGQRQRIREAYLRTVSRPPTPPEIKRAEEYLEDIRLEDGLRDLLWALLNSKEFLLNH